MVIRQPLLFLPIKYNFDYIGGNPDRGGASLDYIKIMGHGDVLPSEMIQCNDRCKAARPLSIWAFGRWLPLGGLLFCPEIGGVRAASPINDEVSLIGDEVQIRYLDICNQSRYNVVYKKFRKRKGI